MDPSRITLYPGEKHLSPPDRAFSPCEVTQSICQRSFQLLEHQYVEISKKKYLEITVDVYDIFSLLLLVFHYFKTVLMSSSVDDIPRVHLWVPVQRQRVSDLLMQEPTFFESSLPHEEQWNVRHFVSY